MSGLIPPVVPIPGDEWKRYPSPLPGPEAPSGRSGDTPAEPDDEAAVIRRQEAERQREQDLVDLLNEDHARIRELLTELRDAGGQRGADRTAGGATARDGATAKDLADVVVAELSRQVTVERRTLVPLVRDNLADAEADQLLGELAELEESVRQLQAYADASGPGISAAELAHRLHRLVENRQRHLYPRLRAACDRERLREEAHRARAARATAPTRPHPRTPDQPPWTRLSDQVVGAADRIRDELTGRPTEPGDLSRHW